MGGEPVAEIYDNKKYFFNVNNIIHDNLNCIYFI